ncbi:MAG: class I SAM-dependent methyltransferase [Massiliimalia sp.]|jgi:tRNA1(Val) A37 N6-methylase TrmN6
MLKLLENTGAENDMVFSMEKDGQPIGECRCQNGRVLSFALTPQWDREDYQKYFVKQLLHRLGAYQGKSVIWESPKPSLVDVLSHFGFVPEGNHWIRVVRKPLHSLDFSHELMKSFVKPGDTVVDATAGNGGDTLFLCKLVGEQGKVIAMDIQPSAVDATKTLLEQNGVSQRAEVLLGDHAELCRQLAPDSVDGAVFNFGWLPGGDHHRFTLPETSISALEGALHAIKPGGRLIASLYHGRENGDREKDTLLEWFHALPQSRYTVMECTISNREGKDPIVLLVQKESNIGGRGR